MRPRLSAARAFLAGAAILAGASFSSARADDSSDDTAMAVPRLALPGSGAGVALPRPLPADEARLLRQAFKDPASPLDAIGKSPLLGHVLADRYLGTATRTGVDDLRAWLAQYKDLPDAPALHALLLTRLPHGVQPPPPPALATFTAAPPGDDVEAATRLLVRNPALDRAVHEAARAGQFDRAKQLIARTRGLEPAYAGLLRAEVAHAMFGQGNDREALALAESVIQSSHATIGAASWVGGLAAWRLGRPELARIWFEAAYRAPLITPGQRSAAAYWAARASLLTRGDHGPWMHRAAHDPRTFYGLLARRVLGQPLLPAANPPQTLGEADIDAVAETPRGQRAFALLQVGQPLRAAAELRLLWTEMREQPGFGRSVLLVAKAASLNDLAAQLETVMQPATMHLPATRLRPAGGFQLDPALVYALTRLESNFDPAAVSRAGAQGLMQLMPNTANYMRAGSASQLRDPGTNLDLGQRLLIQLSQYESIGADLIRLLAAYNVGNGTFAHWLETMRHEDDPLLFIESIPGEETRAYIPRALAYTWLYAAQLGLPSPSLDELAAGLWPRLVTRPDRRPVTARIH